MTSNTLHVRSNSSLANFKDWAQSISNWMTTIGWVQTADTGQVNWSTIASVPTVGTYVYEIWKPGDALTTFYVKIEYGTNNASTNTGPSMRLSAGTTTDGAGTLTGFFTATHVYPANVVLVTSNVTTYNCYYCGDSSFFVIMLWRDDPTAQAPMLFGVQRSINSSGAYTSDFFTVFGSSSGTGRWFQQSVLFGVGAGTDFTQALSAGGMLCSKYSSVSVTSGLFNGSIPLYPMQVELGAPKNVQDVVMLGYSSDYTEAATYTIAAGDMPYGISHTYLASKFSPFLNAGPGGAGNSCLLMRYD